MQAQRFGQGVGMGQGASGASGSGHSSSHGAGSGTVNTLSTKNEGRSAHMMRSYSVEQIRRVVRNASNTRNSGHPFSIQVGVLHTRRAHEWRDTGR
jgi:hypothetical protein